VFVAAAVMGVVTWGVDQVTVSALPGSSLAMRSTRLLITIGASLGALVAVATVLRIPEFAEARDLVVGKLKRMVG
jgi:hypothetical protein